MRCPYCGSTGDWAMMKPRWMARLPWMRNRRCPGCGREFARWMRVIPLRHEVARFLSQVWLLLWLVAMAVGFGLSVAWVISWRNGQV